MKRRATLERFAAAVCVAAAPVVLTVGDVLAREDFRTVYALPSFRAILAYYVALPLLFAAGAKLAGLFGDDAPVASLLARGLVTLGFLGGVSIEATRLARWALRGTDAAAYDRIADAVPADVQGAWFALVFIPGLLMPIGLAVVAIGIWRWTRAPRWAAAALFIGAVLFPVGRISVTHEVVLVSDALLLLGMLSIARELGRGTELWAGGPGASPRLTEPVPD